MTRQKRDFTLRWCETDACPACEMQNWPRLLLDCYVGSRDQPAAPETTVWHIHTSFDVGNLLVGNNRVEPLIEWVKSQAIAMKERAECVALSFIPIV